MNVDSSYFSHNNNAACGRVFRDHLDTFVKTFAYNLGRCSIMQAELWAIVKGLQLAITNEKGALTPTLVPLIEDIWILVNRVQHIDWRHTLREANSVADILAKKGQELIHGLHVFDYPTSEIKSALRLDGIGSFRLRGSG
ncbi:hypothetical protein Ahy_A02g008797 [Arachis hypogaea]|uniref:RNase H type-1 domain-containing protein n=1 Tax=Arachis hypogaea TaxID=3818 RepID=A0A445EFF1_ARAHY|nr:uncharacterized protein LOC112721574 [Arachis hypogaea]RYR74167.1 hypothetical protein Ahy_A02g008797 [Arachis hypogaea]